MTTTTETQQMVKLSLIRPGNNPRRHFNPEKHAELVASIRLRGLLQPILVRPVNEGANEAGEGGWYGFELVAGGRRYRAAVEVFGESGLVPAIVRAMTDQEALEAAIDENDVREDASETEQADAAVRALTACGDDRAEAARRLGWSTFKLDRRLALAGLSDAVKAALDERRIKVGHAELLAACPADKQDIALNNIITHNLDVVKTRQLLMRVTQNLAAATFDKTECIGCGYNSARQRALFETHVEDGHCTNAACFALKVEAALPTQVPAVLAPSVEAFNAASPNKCRICDCTEDNACVGGCGWADDTKTLCDNPDCVGKAAGKEAPKPVAEPEQASAEAKPAPATSPAVGKLQAKVTADGLRTKLAAFREETWRAAVAAAILESADHVRVANIATAYIKARAPMAFSQVTELANELEVDLRQTWRVDGGLLDQLNKDELKFIAQECGLIAHMGEKKFAQIFGQTTLSVASSMLHATGFTWAGRIPGCMSLDGAYGLPPAPEESAAADHGAQIRESNEALNGPVIGNAPAEPAPTSKEA